MGVQLGCGLTTKEIRGRPYLYFWHYEDRGGRRVQVFRYLGSARSEAARQRLVPEGARLRDLVDALVGTYPRLAGHTEAMLLAVNLSYASPDVVLHDGDEVAVMPPVSGGGT